MASPAHGETGGEYDRHLLLSRETGEPEWSQVEISWEDLRLALIQVEDGLDRLAVALGSRTDDAVLERDGLLGALSAQMLGIRLLRRGSTRY